MICYLRTLKSKVMCTTVYPVLFWTKLLNFVEGIALLNQVISLISYFLHHFYNFETTWIYKMKTTIFYPFTGRCAVYNYEVHHNRAPNSKNCSNFSSGCPEKQYFSKNASFCKLKCWPLMNVIVYFRFQFVIVSWASQNCMFE